MIADPVVTDLLIWTLYFMKESLPEAVRGGTIMKYGESAFDLLYLLFAVISGWVILKNAQNRKEKLMGATALILGCGDAFHLIPRVLNYFINADFTAALGIGKLITSVTMTVFYVLLYYIWLEDHKQEGQSPEMTSAIWGSAGIRIVLCLFPQNGWLENSSDMTWGIIRNIPFVILGALVCRLYFQTRNSSLLFRPVWIYILLSFLFYIPVAVFAGVVPILGMLMLPKTACYILLITVFLRAVLKREPAGC